MTRSSTRAVRRPRSTSKSPEAHPGTLGQIGRDPPGEILPAIAVRLPRGEDRGALAPLVSSSIADEGPEVVGHRDAGLSRGLASPLHDQHDAQEGRLVIRDALLRQHVEDAREVRRVHDRGQPTPARRHREGRAQDARRRGAFQRPGDPHEPAGGWRSGGVWAPVGRKRLNEGIEERCPRRTVAATRTGTPRSARSQARAASGASSRRATTRPGSVGDAAVDGGMAPARQGLRGAEPTREPAASTAPVRSAPARPPARGSAAVAPLIGTPVRSAGIAASRAHAQAPAARRPGSPLTSGALPPMCPAQQDRMRSSMSVAARTRSMAYYWHHPGVPAQRE